MRLSAILSALVAVGLSACYPGATEQSALAANVPLAEAEMQEAARVPAPTPAAAPDTTLPDLPEGFVRLRDVAPSIAEEMRYATSYNFVGERIDGYVDGTCILTAHAAEALRHVAQDLAPRGLGIKVYDCYRPQTAVNHFARWARGDDERMKPAFYPDEPRGQLFSRGYIALRSGHSRGSTMDLTLVRLPADDAVLDSSAYPDRTAAPLPRCDRPLPLRLDEKDLDMGTAYDCLSPVAATAYRNITHEARDNRQTLKRAMDRRGLRNYSKEWWHFTLSNEPFPRTYFDFPVE